MPKLKIETSNNQTFGDRLAKLRKQAGYSQRDLARETGISQRMIAYYEKQTQYPPTHLLPVLSKALNATADQLLGMEKSNSNKKQRDMKLWRRFDRIEQLNPNEKRQIIMLLDTFIEKNRLKEKMESV